MPSTEFECPDCGTAVRSQKPLAAGTQIRCPKCSVVFRIGEGRSAASSSVKGKPAPAAPPPSQSRSSKVTQRPPERPVSRRSDDDDDDDDRPRRGKKKKGSSGAMIGIIVGGAVLAIVVVIGVAVAVVALGGKSSSTQIAVNSPNPVPTQAPPRPEPNMGANPRPINPAPASKPTPPSSDPGIGAAEPAAAGSVQEIYNYVLKSTVLIVNIMQGKAALGSGAVVDANDRLILTNYHVVANTTELFVFFPTYVGGKLVSEKEKYLGNLKKGADTPEGATPAEVVAVDKQRDLALVRVSKVPAGTEPLPLAKGLATIGERVHSVGNPGASGALWVYTQGQVRSVYHHKWRIKVDEAVLELNSEVVETQSPTNHGDSGGPLVNDRGELVAVTEGGSAEGHLISLFISLTEARAFIEREYQKKFAKAWTPVVRTPLRIRSGGSSGNVTELVAALDNADAKTRAGAAKALGEMGPDARIAIRRLVKALKDPDEFTSRVAAEALTKIGAPGRDDLAILLDALKDLKPEVRRYVATAIGQIGADASSSADKLVDALTDQDEHVRENLVRSLGSLGPKAKTAAMPGLTRALTDNTKEVRVAAASSLGSLLTPPTADDVPILVTILKQKDPEASVFGARGLAKVGKPAKAAIPDLMEAAKSADAGVRREAIAALAAIGPDAKTSVPLYIMALKDMSDSAVRQSALLALGQLGKDLAESPEGVAAVIEAAKDKDVPIKRAALAAIGKLGPVIGAAGAKQVLPSLIDALQAKEADLRDQALETIAGMGPLAQGAIPTLISIIEKQDIKLMVDKSNGKIFLQEADDAYLDKFAKPIGKVGLPAVKNLIGSFKLAGLNYNAGLVVGVCRALGEIGPPAKDAVRDLRLIANDPQLPAPFRSEADRAIRKIQTK